MPTTKPRINITVSSNTLKYLKILAKRDQMPVATKAGRLIEMALEFEEDLVFGKLAKKRFANKKIKWISNRNIWKHIKRK